MTDNRIYDTIAKRCGGDIYIGVVGPVRTGKSTFIRKFLDSVLIPNIENEYDKERAKDEVPQSGSGRTVTTTEPKFIPAEAAQIKIGSTQFNARMIDCVGYMVDGAMGAEEDGASRMVMTPWSREPMPFTEAAELGTEKVVREHSTIAMLVTTDGSILDIPRENYIAAEERVAAELKETGKPFAIILNSSSPETEEAHALAVSLEKKYGAPVALVNCTKLNSDDAGEILSLVVGEFPLKELVFKLPDWCTVLPKGHPLKVSIRERICQIAGRVKKISELERELEQSREIAKLSLDAGLGICRIDMPLRKEDYYSTVSELAGISLSSDRELFSALIELSAAKREYDKVKAALTDVKDKGYGIVMPTREELTISEPILVKQGSGYGIKVTASAESIHMIKTGIKADVCPVIGSEEQSEEVMKTMLGDYDEDPSKLLESKLLGRSIYDLVSDGMNAKLLHMPQDARGRLGETLERIINEGSNGLICILL